MSFDPSSPQSHEAGIFGLPFTREQAKLVLLPVPWEVTVSYGGGSSKGPQTILQASPQLDLYDVDWGRVYEPGIYMEPIDAGLIQQNEELRSLSESVIEQLTQAEGLNAAGEESLIKVNAGCKHMVDWVYEQTKQALAEDKFCGIIGGDHSVPLGAIQAVLENTKEDVGILHIDAHYDLRKAYEGFIHSHASIMYNALNLDRPPSKLVQVGIRDFCEEELEFARSKPDVCHTFFDQVLKRDLFGGLSWQQLVSEILAPLPDQVYVSFDIDGLSPEFCPHTGTPVPGGLSYDQACYLLTQLVESGRRIVGFDLCEVSPSSDPTDEWDGNVGARILYKLAGALLTSQKLVAHSG